MSDFNVFRGLVEVESAPVSMPSAPAKAVSRTYPGAPQNENNSIELDRLDRIAVSSGPPTPPEELNVDLEMDRAASPVEPINGVEVLPSVLDPYMNRFRFLAACLMIFANGLNDSAPGALIPYMEEYYDINYAIVSLIFVGNALGFVVAAAFLDSLRERLGRARFLGLAQVLLVAGNIPLLCGGPFPSVVAGFFLIGFGMSMNLAVTNLFCGSLRNSTTVLGIVHGSYGVGGTIGPLMATAMVTIGKAVWSRYYAITLALAVGNGVLAVWAFWHYDRELSGASQPLTGERASASARASVSAMLSSFSNRVVLLGAIFIFAYQGAEVSISGWVISFLISARQGDPGRVGYVTAGFWAGITLGRFLLSAPAHRIGEKKFVYCVVAGAAVFELLVWLVPNVVGDAVAVSIVGVLLGPVYPCAAAIFLRSMQKSEQTNGIGVITAFGSSGGAAAPFTTGILAQAVGTFVLHPIAIGLFAVMMVCWYALPTKPKRSE